jgi:hypothetical protein
MKFMKIIGVLLTILVVIIAIFFLMKKPPIIEEDIILFAAEIGLQGEGNSTEDGYLDTFVSGTEYGNETWMFVSNSSATGNARIAIVQFDNTVPAGQLIASANLSLYNRYSGSLDSGEEINISIILVNQTYEFTEGNGGACTGVEFCGNNTPVPNVTSYVSEALNFSGNSPNQDYIWDVTEMISHAYNQSYSNFSLMIYTTAIIAGSPALDDDVEFYTKEYTTVTARRPKLEILYTSNVSTITIAEVYPTADISVDRFDYFNYTVNVTCSAAGADCGGMSVYLDPSVTNSTPVAVNYTTDGDEYSQTYSLSKVNTQNCAHGTCSSSNSWEYGFDNYPNASTEIEWHFDVEDFGIAGSDITELTIKGGGCWYGGESEARDCDNSDGAEVQENNVSFSVWIYDWTAETFSQVGSSITLNGTNSSEYTTYSLTKSSGFVSGNVNSTGKIKIRYNLTGVMDYNTADLHGVYDYILMDLTYGKGLISTTHGSTPFFVNGTNPSNITLNSGQSQTVTFLVNATAGNGTTHQFYAYVNQTADSTIGDETPIRTITISNVSLEGILIDWDTPTSSAQRINGTTNEYSFEVGCTRTSTPTTESCSEDNCVDFGSSNGTIDIFYGNQEGSNWEEFEEFSSVQQFHRDVNTEYMRVWIMCVSYAETTVPYDGSTYDYTNIDKFLNATLNTGAIPMLVFAHNYDTCTSDHHMPPPASTADFVGYLGNATLHFNQSCIDGNYSATCDFSDWYVEIWNEPFGSTWWDNDPSNYIVFFNASYDKVKEINPNTKVGGYGGTYYPGHVTNGNEFVEDTDADFIAIHHYPSQDGSEGRDEWLDYRDRFYTDGPQDLADKIVAEGKTMEIWNNEYYFDTSSAYYDITDSAYGGMWTAFALSRQVKSGNIDGEMHYKGTPLQETGDGGFGMWSQNSSGQDEWFLWPNYWKKKEFVKYNINGSTHYNVVQNGSYELLPVVNSNGTYVTVVWKEEGQDTLTLEFANSDIITLEDSVTGESFSLTDNKATLSFTEDQVRYLIATESLGGCGDVNVTINTLENGTIPQTAGTSPFYHNGSTREYECGAVDTPGDCTATFYVTANSPFTSYNFYGEATSSDSGVSSINSSQITITILSTTSTCNLSITGNNNINCADNCNWVEAYSLVGNLTLDGSAGSGVITLLNNLTFTDTGQYIYIGSGCTLSIGSGGGIN